MFHGWIDMALVVRGGSVSAVRYTWDLVRIDLALATTTHSLLWPRLVHRYTCVRGWCLVHHVWRLPCCCGLGRTSTRSWLCASLAIQKLSSRRSTIRLSSWLLKLVVGMPALLLPRLLWCCPIQAHVAHLMRQIRSFLRRRVRLPTMLLVLLVLLVSLLHLRLRLTRRLWVRARRGHGWKISFLCTLVIWSPWLRLRSLYSRSSVCGGCSKGRAHG